MHHFGTSICLIVIVICMSNRSWYLDLNGYGIWNSFPFLYAEAETKPTRGTNEGKMRRLLPCMFLRRQSYAEKVLYRIKC